MTTVEGALAGARASERSQFFFTMAVLCCVTAFAGFAPTFWLPMTRGAYMPSPLVTIHGIIFSSWMLFFVLQTWLVAAGRTANHRAAGLFGISLASVMTVFGIIAAIERVRDAAAVGELNNGLAFAILPVWHIAFFAALVALAIMNIRRPDWHRRLMLVATISMLDAPLARLYFYFVTFHRHMPVPAGLPPHPPVLRGITPWEIAVDLYVLVPILYDWRTRGRPHPAYLYGGGAIVLLELLEAPISHTMAWHGVAAWIVSLAH
jgi:hypothetical protein